MKVDKYGIGTAVNEGEANIILKEKNSQKIITSTRILVRKISRVTFDKSKLPKSFSDIKKNGVEFINKYEIPPILYTSDDEVFTSDETDKLSIINHKIKVNCDSDTYGISLVNPSGSNVIYNFDSVLDKMNYSVNDTHINPNTNNPYTLAELVTLWKSTFNSSVTGYRSLGNSLIENTKKLETYTELLQVAFAKYQKFVDANNNKVSFQLPNIPQPEYLFSTGDYKCYNGNNDLNYYYATSNDYDDISAANSAYWGFYNTYSATVTAITQTTEWMKAMALPLTFNYKTIKKEYDSYGGTANYKPIFTPTEIKELYKFIYEGEWETSIIKFSDDFKPTDIYNSLIDIFTVAKTEMDNIYSKPIYEFSAEIADIFRMEEMRAACADICLGNSLYIADGDNWIMPVLLQVNVDYDKTNGTTMTFSTDYKRKPLEYRFAKLFATIQQTSVKTSKFTFD